MNVQALPADVTPDGFDTMFDTNVRGAFFMAQAAGRSMIGRGEGGRIVNIASIGAHTVLPGLTIYCMTKAAVGMMTQSLAKEWARHQINVNAMCPGFIETELNSEWFQSEGVGSRSKPGRDGASASRKIWTVRCCFLHRITAVSSPARSSPSTMGNLSRRALPQMPLTFC